MTQQTQLPDLETREGREAVMMDTLRWLQLGAPHGVVGDRNDVGFDMAVLKRDACEVAEVYVKDYAGSDCGTTCCMLGHIELRRPELTVAFDELMYLAQTQQAEGVVPADMPVPTTLWRLFYPTSNTLSITDSHGLHKYLSMKDVTPEWAAAVLSHYIETGQVDWAQGRHYALDASFEDDRLLAASDKAGGRA